MMQESGTLGKFWFISTDNGITWYPDEYQPTGVMALRYIITSSHICVLDPYGYTIYDISLATARWRETSGAWSDEFPIGPSYSTELTGYGITLGFAQVADHIAGDMWTFRQGRMGALSVKDPDGVEYFSVRDNEVYNLTQSENINATGVYNIPEDFPIGHRKTYRRMVATSGTPITLTPPSGATIEGNTHYKLLEQYASVTIEKVSATEFVIVNRDWQRMASVTTAGSLDLDVSWVKKLRIVLFGGTFYPLATTETELSDVGGLGSISVSFRFETTSSILGGAYLTHDAGLKKISALGLWNWSGYTFSKLVIYAK
jgi:hypothetical protein